MLTIPLLAALGALLAAFGLGWAAGENPDRDARWADEWAEDVACRRRHPSGR